MDYKKEALEKHKELGGKLEVTSKDTLDSREKMSIYYTPGVAAVSSHVALNPDEARDYTWLGNNVAVVSDGSAVLGLGNIGPYGALPVMEGKAMIFKEFANIDAVPIVLDVHSADEIVSVVRAIAPSFGGINLEDIAAPICFEVEERLKSELSIPVFHDDQHGTAIVVLAGLMNAAKVTGRDLESSRIVIAGAGAAGVAIARLLNKYAPKAEILAVDSVGIIEAGRSDLNTAKRLLLEFSNKDNIKGSLVEAVNGADIFVGVSRPNLLSSESVQKMAKDPIVFALSNPIPEIMPDIAKEAGAAVIATGRSDFPNQVNNSLVFPGVFRGALDNRVEQITDDHKIAVAIALSDLVANPTPEEVIPGPFTEGLVEAVASVIR